MPSYFFGIDLSPAVRARLTALCYGLPYVQWMEEESLSLCLLRLGKLNHSGLHEVKLRLAPLFFSSFSLTLQGLSYQLSRKGNRGTLWLGIEKNALLESLKNEVDSLLKGLELPYERNFAPQIILGYFDRLNPDKLSDYFLSHEGFQIGPFEVSSCSLLCIRSTSKNLFIERIAYYPASQRATGED